MQIIDSHCHLNILKKKQEHSETLLQAKQHGVVGMLNISVDIDTADEVIAQTELQDNIWASIGIHPCHCPIAPMTNADCEVIKKHSQHPKVIAIGESGLDFFHTKAEDSQHQLQYFEQHIELAKKLNLPIIIHCRNARHKVIEMLKMYNAQDCGGVMHCFAEDWETAQAALDLGFYISFSGIVSYPKSEDLRAVARSIPEDRLLIETDSPYLSPYPMRGKYNQPAYVKYTLAKLAEIKGKDIAQMAHITTANFQRCFKVEIQSSD